MDGAGPLRLLLADDHLVVREGLVSLLSGKPEFQVIAQAGTGRSAVDLYRKHRPDVSLIDMEMPGGDGVEVTSVIRSIDPSAKLIILTSYVGEEDVFRAMSAGARGYLLKDIDSESLFASIRKVAAGGKSISDRVAEALSDRLPGQHLSDRERSILKLVAEGNSNAEIGLALSICESTVKYHLNNILSKLQVADRTEAVVVAVRKGFLRIK